MAIDDVLEKATIEFPRKLDLRNAENLLKSIAKDLHGNVRYTISEQKNIGYHIIESQDFQEKTINIQVNGSIDTKNFVLGPFKLRTAENNYSSFSGINFQITPGWDIEDYRPEVIKLWDDVRKVVTNYFKKNKK